MIFWFSGCTRAPVQQKSAVNSFLDLSDHDFSKQTIVDLSGTWFLYPDELLTPETLANRTNGPAPIPIKVPGLWKNQGFGGKKGPIFGKGTYVLEIKLPEDCPELTFRFEHFQGSSQLYINSMCYGGPLITDPKKVNSVKPNSPRYYRVTGDTSTVQVLIQLANYWDSNGIGFKITPSLGTTEATLAIRSYNIGYESFLIGLLLLAALYHAMLYLIQRRDKALLLFSFIALAVILRQISTSEKFWLTQSGLMHFTMLRLENISVYALCLLFIIYFRYLYPKQIIRPVYISLIIIGTIFCCTSTFFPIQIHSSLLFESNLYVILCLANIIFVLIQAILKRENQARIMCAGFLIIAFLTIFDVLLTTYMIGVRFLMPLGLIPFIMAQSYLLAKRYTRDTAEAEKLRVSTARLTELDHVKTNFLANISHELRTPITLIKAPVDAITSGEYGEQVSKDDKVFALISNNVNRLLRLVENLLSMTRLESGKRYDLKPTDLVQLVPIYIDEFKMVAQNAGLALSMENRCDSPLVAELELKAFEIIFFNLMSNAIKFTKPGGSVTVCLSKHTVGKKEFARIEVIDTGIGIRNEDLPNLFIRYGKIYDKERQHYEGNGIGLSLARETARAMGGDISVQSTIGKGSNFCVEFPLSENEALPLEKDLVHKPNTTYLNREYPEAQKTSNHSPKKSSRVLVVEDHEEMRRFIAGALATEHEVIEAGDGREALNILATIEPPDLIVSDIMMPNIDGVGLFESTRANDSLASIPFMFLTARNESDEKIKLLRGGSIEYMVKPFSVEELRAKVSAIISLRNNERVNLLERVQSAINGSFSGTTLQAEPAEPLYPPDLTVRETEILKKVAEGATDKEIAEHYGIAIRTASNHVGSILKKTGMTSRQSLMIRFGKQEEPNQK